MATVEDMFNKMYSRFDYKDTYCHAGRKVDVYEYISIEGIGGDPVINLRNTLTGQTPKVDLWQFFSMETVLKNGLEKRTKEAED